jgi:regulator of protease activity HflC (stomatin/prohibitin superfamily)
MSIHRASPPKDRVVSTRSGKLTDVESERIVNSTLLGILVVFVFFAVTAVWTMSKAPIIPVIATVLLMLWSCVVAKIQYSYALIHHWAPKEDEVLPSSRLGKLLTGTHRHFRIHFATLWQWVILLFAVTFSITGFLTKMRFALEPGQVRVSDLRLAAVVMLASACFIYLYGNYVKAVQKQLINPYLGPMLQISRLIFLSCAVTSAMLFLFLATNYDVCWVGWIFIGISFVLALEPLIRISGRFYQPRALRKKPSPVGSSVVLEVIFGSSHGFKGIIGEIEELIGMKTGEVWILQFFKETIEFVLFAGLLVGWLSTCITSIPLGSQGVLNSFGCFRNPPLDPGIHFTLPWPFQTIITVKTDQIREISLGFSKDLSKPLLWTERHVEGEKNLLIGNGESILTINLPILYRIADPIVFLKTTTDAEMALRDLAERKLIQIATARESFHMMTEDRQAIAENIQHGLQEDADHLGLGLQIVFVGLKDIHPPVEVAPSYQNVVSAQEKKESMIDEAKAYEASTLPLAYAEANTLILNAQSAFTNRDDK